MEGGEKIMTGIVATSLIASQPPEQGATATSTVGVYHLSIREEEKNAQSKIS